MNLSLDLDIFHLLIGSLVFNIVLIVKSLVFGPRKPRSVSEVSSSLGHIARFLRYNLFIITNKKTPEDTAFIVGSDFMTKIIMDALKEKDAALAKEKDNING